MLTKKLKLNTDCCLRKRQEKTKSSVMTMLFKKVMPAHRTRCADDNILLAVDPTTQRVYHYQKTGLDKNPKIPVVSLT